MTRDRSGFTLIELLVVIAIIALLLAILMPGLSRVRAQSKNVVCKANLRHWALIFQIYVQDNDNKFHTSGMPTGGFSYDRTWIKILKPYYQDPDIRFCPTATKLWMEGAQNPFSAWSAVGVTSLEEWDSGSYGINTWITNPPSTVERYVNKFESKDHWRTADVPGGYTIPMVLDCWWCRGYPCHMDKAPAYDGDIIGSYSNVNDMQRYCLNRHNGTTNGAFLDASVRAIGLKELWRLRWHRRFDTNFKTMDELNAEGPWLQKYKDYPAFVDGQRTRR